MNHILIMLIALTASLSTLAKINSPEVVYGDDNRSDYFDVSNSLHKTLSHSTAGMVTNNWLANRGDHFEIKAYYTLQSGLNVCSSERFSQQPLLANCSGFLVADDILVTAGHCVAEDPTATCNNFSWIFDLHMTSRNSINLDDIPVQNVYKCKQVIKYKFNSVDDFAIIRLDRKVQGRTPLNYRKSGKIADDTKLLVIGHPSMLPTKISDNGFILNNDNTTKILTNLDTFQGNSGSAVFDSKSGMIEGILVSGKTDYVLSDPTDKESCKVVNECDMQGKNCIGTDAYTLYIPGENVTRITSILNYLP